MAYFRVLNSANRPMQRLGFLKYLLQRCAALDASNLEMLGHDLIDTVTDPVRTAFTLDLADYVKRRLTDGVYRALRDQVSAWERGNTAVQASVELQDLYLADQCLPSRTGKLVAEDWRKYPYLGLNLSLIRAGTWSALERGKILLRLTPKREMSAFAAYDPGSNPLLLSAAQRLFFLYCILDNDGDIVKSLYAQLSERDVFSDRDAGDLLPDILQAIGAQFWNRDLPAAERERLDRLLKISNSIRQSKGRTYTGGGAREEAIKVRLEPFVDLGFLNKDDPYRYQYHLTAQARAFFAELTPRTNIETFLEDGFFRTWAAAHCPTSVTPVAPGQLRSLVIRAWNDLRSPLGYTPIVDTALLAGIYAATEQGSALEIASVRQALRDWQKEAPDEVRFSVDRMGNMAHVRLLKPPNSVR